MDIIKQSNVLVAMKISHAMWLENPSATIPIPKETQEAIRNTYTRLTVTTCLYLSPNNNARSLSTLMAVIVHIDTGSRIVLPIR